MERKLLIGVFGTGAAVMILELLGTRIVAPYIGASMYVWTAMIGVVLGCLAVGYWIGGEIARRRAEMEILSLVVGVSAFWVVILALFKDLMMMLVVEVLQGPARAVGAAVTLFGIPAVLLGLVSPLAAQILIKRAEASGEWVGRLYAMSTVGSIVGTFLTGFWLVPEFGHLRSLYLVASLLAFISWWWAERKKLWQVVLIVVAVVGVVRLWSWGPSIGEVVMDKDTAYSRVIVVGEDEGRAMWIDRSRSSKVYLDEPLRLGFEYYPFYDLMFWHTRELERVLMIGGAGLGYPRYAVIRYPRIEMTVVEIDPELYSIAKHHLGYKDNERVRMVFEDGRVFLNKNEEKYQAILLDVFSGYTVPSHMVSREAIWRMKQSLVEGGIVVMNMIGAAEGEGSRLTSSIYAGFAEQFINVRVFGVRSSEPNEIQNLVLVASDEPLSEQMSSLGEEKRLLERPMRMRKGRVLVDDWSPSEYLSALMLW